QLFDAIVQNPPVAQAPVVAQVPPAASSAPRTAPVAATAEPAPSVGVEADGNTQPGAGDNMINSVGQLTRQLHNTLAELGLDRSLQDATAAALPDARQRIAYVVKLTEDAAGKCLNAVEHATPLQEGLAAEATALAGKWDSIFEGKSDVTEFKALAQSTRDYLHGVTARTDETRSHLREVMIAQEFQDLTGQVLKKISELATTLESQLVMLLVQNSPTPLKPEAASLLNGPAIDGSAPNVVASQAQVDELLESLGF
ncbi:MAG: protein phosphatase CheZ, partial [Pseudomonadota bacterium]